MSVAKKAAALAAPELVVPLAAAKKLLQHHEAAQRSTELLNSGVVVVPPPEHRRLLTFGKDRIHVRTRKGIRIVSVDRAPSLSAGEAALGVVLVGTAAAAYYAKQHGWIPSASSSSSGSSNPANASFWIPSSKGWGFLRWG